MIQTPNIKHQTSNSVQGIATPDSGGFTLVETLIAITLLMLAVIEPMSLTARSLQSAYYARDQISASSLAQEGVEAVRSVRDAQILKIATGVDSSADLFGPIPIDQDFTIDAQNNTTTVCSGTCPPLQINPSGVLYGYGIGWTNSAFTRTLHACYIQPDATCTGVTSDEMHLMVTVRWQTNAYPARSIVLYENLYRWAQ